MVLISILPHAEFRPNGHCGDAPLFTFTVVDFEFTNQNIANKRITIEQIIPTCISPFVHVGGGIDM